MPDRLPGPGRAVARGRSGRKAGTVILALAGLAVGLLLYVVFLLDQPLRTRIRIVDPNTVSTISLDDIKLTDPIQDDGSWAEAGRTRVYVHPDFPIVKVDQADPLVENILVFGVDARRASEVVCRADSLIIITIDRRSRSIKLTSVMRDSQVLISGRSEPDRINAAYAYGGVGLLINTLNETLDLDIQRFAMFDFWSAASLIDAIGGIELTIAREEIPHANQSITEQNELFAGTDPSLLLEEAGLQHINGRQAVAWARIRKLDSDYIRTSRQRTMMTAMISRMADAQLSTLFALANGGLTAFETNMRTSDMIRIGLNALPLTDEIMEYRVPQDGLFTVNPDPWMMVVDWEKQSMLLHAFIWGEP
jgi:LCP family protein required for cell wall assembly